MYHRSEKVKLLYIANARIPSEKAHPYQILKMCEAFAKNGMDVELVVPFRVQTNKRMRAIDDIWQYYGVKDKFRITPLPSLDLIFVGSYLPSWIEYLLFYLQASTFYLFAILHSLLRKAEIIYSRDPEFLFILGLIKPSWRPRMYYEAHTFPGSRIGKWLRLWVGRRIGGLIAITNKLKELYTELGIPEDRILVAHHGVDLARFERKSDKKQARKKLGLPLGKKLVCYTGHLYPWKGVYVLAQSAKLLSGCQFVVVGGMADDIKKYRAYLDAENISNIKTVGYVQPALVADYLSASDVLVLPNSAKKRVSDYYSYPIKLFEYMTAERPIIASNLPSLREILRDGENAILVEPDDPRALLKGIQRVLDDPDLARRISEQAYSEVMQYSWEERARKILEFITDALEGMP